MKANWIDIKKLIKNSSNDVKVELLSEQNTDLIESINVSEDSVLGQVLSHISGVIINGYLRIYGFTGSLDINKWNDKIKAYYPGNKLIIAHDVFGGVFAINNGDFDDNIRNIWYFAPDTLQWENLEINYADFISWVLSDKVLDFYESFLWSDAALLLKNIGIDEGISVYPCLWSQELNIESASKKRVSFDEILGMNKEYQKKFKLAQN